MIYLMKQAQHWLNLRLGDHQIEFQKLNLRNVFKIIRWYRYLIGWNPEVKSEFWYQVPVGINLFYNLRDRKKIFRNFQKFLFPSVLHTSDSYESIAKKNRNSYGKFKIINLKNFCLLLYFLLYKNFWDWSF